MFYKVFMKCYYIFLKEEDNKREVNQLPVQTEKTGISNILFTKRYSI